MSKLNLETFKNKFDEEWWKRLKPFFETEEAFKIYEYLKQISRKGVQILPESSKTFEAFGLCNYENLKIVIIGIEPYAMVIGKQPVANGLSFDCSNTQKLQPSLQYFWEAVSNNFEDITDFTPNLDWIAEQGVLLLNSSLTVEKNKIGSHLDIDGKSLWEPFMKFLFTEALFNNTGLIFVLMGKEGQKLEKYISPLGNYILKTQHPSFAARNQNDDWNADNVFKKANNIIAANNGVEFCIEWNKEKYEFQKDLKTHGLTTKDLEECPF
jgi:uracil-DNA glycosylase